MSDNWKDKIKASVIADRFNKCFNGELELTKTQVDVGKILFDRVAPVLARTEMTGKDGGAIETKDVTKSDEDILKQYLKEPK